MLRGFFYLTGCVALGWLAYKVVAWQLVVQLTVICALSIWVCLGAVLVVRQLGTRTGRYPVADLDRNHLNAAALRADYAARHGEDMAAQIDRKDPQFWARTASSFGLTK